VAGWPDDADHCRSNCTHSHLISALGTIRRSKTTRLKRCDVNASGRPSLRQPRRRYGFNSKRSRTNATVVSAHSIAVATWLRVADVIDDLSRSPVHPVNVKANSRAMTQTENLSQFRLLSDFLLLSPSSLRGANVRCFLIDRQSPPYDPARIPAVIASNRRFKYFGTAAFAVRLLRLDQEIVSGVSMSLKRVANIRTYAQRPVLTFKPCVSAVHILCTE
jgi:hypothetical protein